MYAQTRKQIETKISVPNTLK